MGAGAASGAGMAGEQAKAMMAKWLGDPAPQLPMQPQQPAPPARSPAAANGASPQRTIPAVWVKDDDAQVRAALCTI